MSKLCPFCQFEIPDSASICGHCESEQPMPAGEFAWTMVFVICLFLGCVAFVWWSISSS